MKSLGIDPGQSGGIAIIEDGRGAAAYKMPETERDIADLIWRHASTVDIAVIERVHSMPGQGVSSTFKFGMNYGLLRGLLIAYRIPFTEVTPQKWMKAMQCQTHGDKNVSKARAQQLFPSLKITHATADALLIAAYAHGLSLAGDSALDSL